MTPIARAGDFEEYDRLHPAIWRHFEGIALAMIHDGRERLSAKRIFEEMRDLHIPRRDDDHFKVNNNFTADYARKFMRFYPQFEGMFEIRERKKSTDDTD